MNNENLIIGIDVGWSEKNASCGVAIRDPLNKIQWPSSTNIYEGKTSIKCSKFRLSGLLEFLSKIPISSYVKIVVVIDGPLGPHGPPDRNRNVDSEFRRNEFNGRMQPMDIEGKDGRIYVNATYKVANAFTDAVAPWPFFLDESKLLIAETNPTVGLALVNRKYNRDELPSRKKPLVPPSDQQPENAIRAKSDFYWRIGGNKYCEEILECNEILKERDHERVAALYCLAVAVSLSNGSATAVGNKDSGVYVFPQWFHRDWINDIKSVGVTGNQPLELENIYSTVCFQNWKSAQVTKVTAAVSTDLPEEDDKACDPENTGDVGWLLLNDNGGVHQKHNSWLSNFGNCVRIRFSVPNTKKATEATLVRANSSGHWRIDSDGLKALGIARMFGFSQSHLSCESSVSIEFELVADCCQNSDA